MQFCGYVPPWLSRILACMGGCIGHSQTPIGQTVIEDRGLEDLSSSCTAEMNQSSTAQSQGNISSVGTSYQPSTSQTSDAPVFVNHGLLLWNQTREQWLQRRRSESRPLAKEVEIGEFETYESLLGGKEPFPEPIPLREMVDFLADVWDMEGRYDER